MKYDQDTLKDIAGYNAHQLAHRADSYAENDAAERFFKSIRDQIIDAAEYVDAEDWEREYVEDYLGAAHEIAENAPDVYTYPKWQEFVGTQAWQEDLDELGGASNDMDANASVALYIIAQRLVNALAVEIQDSITDDDDDDPHDNDGNRLTPSEV